MGLTRLNKHHVMVRDNWTCALCKIVLPDTEEMSLVRIGGGNLWERVGNHMTVDHVIPRSKGGTNAYDNLTAMCYICNNMKGDGVRKNNPPDSKLSRKQRRIERRRQYGPLVGDGTYTGYSPLYVELNPDYERWRSWKKVLDAAKSS